MELPFITDVSNYHSVIYGTYWTNWDDFKINGIRKTKRNPIQFCTAIHGEKRNSVSTNSEIFIYFNLQKAMDGKFSLNILHTIISLNFNKLKGKKTYNYDMIIYRWTKILRN